MLDPFQFLLVSIAGWMNQSQQDVNEYLREENRVLLPLWAVLGHNLLYILVGFAWLFFVSPGPPGEQDITMREDPPQRYDFAAMLCFLLFAHNLLTRIEGADQRMWVWLGTGQWQLLLLFGLLSVLCQLLFWSEVVQVNNRFTTRT